MDAIRKTALFVNAGTWGDVSSGTQDENSTHFVRLLQSTGIVDVKVVPDVEQAEDLLRTQPVDAIVFRTRGMEGIARRIKREHSGVRVVVLSAFAPFSAVVDPDLIWINKLDVEDPAGFARAILG